MSSVALTSTTSRKSTPLSALLGGKIGNAPCFITHANATRTATEAASKRTFWLERRDFGWSGVIPARPCLAQCALAEILKWGAHVFRRQKVETGTETGIVFREIGNQCVGVGGAMLVSDLRHEGNSTNGSLSHFRPSAFYRVAEISQMAPVRPLGSGTLRAAETVKDACMNRTRLVFSSRKRSSRFTSIGYCIALGLVQSFTSSFAAAQAAQRTAPDEREPGAASTPAVPSAPHVVVPPRLIEQTPVPYPAGATGDTTIVVTVTVGVDGTVRDVTANEDREPFASIAVASVKTWRFEPATRDGVALAAKIRMEIAFYAPVMKPAEEEEPAETVVAPPPTPSGKGSARTVKAAPAQLKAIEVTVLGEKRAPMMVSLSRTEVRQIPGTFGDPFRAIELLPGVTPIISGLPYFYVRGAPPGNVGYFLDGIRVPYLYHVAIGPSVVHPGMVDSVELYSGGYPSRFGRYAGGIVSAETTAPTPVTRGEGNLRLYDAGALVETGFAGGRGTVLLGGRYSYTAAVISLVAKGVKLDYRDYQARVTYDVTAKDRVSVVAFGAYDLLAQDSNGISTIGFGSEFYRGDTRWDHSLSNGGKVRTAITLGYDQTAIGGQRNAQDRMLGVRSELDQPIGSNVRWRFGVDTVRDSYKVTKPLFDDPDNPTSQRFQSLFPSRTDLVVGANTELAVEVAKGFIVTPGIRTDYYMSQGATAVGIDPRISARFKLTKDFSIVHAYGIAHQPPSFVLPIPGLALGSLAGGLQTSYQTSAGIEWAFAKGTILRSNLFNNIFEKLTDALSIPEGRGQSINERTTGRAYGLEVFLNRKVTQNIGGILSYTLSQSTRRLGNSEFPSAFDRRHVLNAALAYNLGRNWRAGTRLVFYTGAPKRTPVTTATTNTEAPTAAAIAAHDANPPRDPAFYRIDLRLEKLWQYSETRHLSFVIEWLNATMRKEVFNGSAIGPITVPSIGLEGAF